MANVHDVAHYMLRRRAMSAMKLQKLLYYSQACHLAEHGKPLFRERIEAWANGPVVREAYDVHRGQFGLSSWPAGEESALSAAERATIDRVLQTYGQRDARWLSERTHAEAPWQDARAGLPEGVRSDAQIDPDLMRRYYEKHRPCEQDSSVGF
jgi:uncharacterized phage-associated protein